MKKPPKRRKRARDEGAYVCPTCGEQIVIPLDASGGTEQKYVNENSNVGVFGPGETWVALGHPTKLDAGGDTSVWQVRFDGVERFALLAHRELKGKEGGRQSAGDRDGLAAELLEGGWLTTTVRLIPGVRSSLSRADRAGTLQC